MFTKRMEGMSEAKKLVDDFNNISVKFVEDLSEDEMNETILKQAELEDDRYYGCVI